MKPAPLLAISLFTALNLLFCQNPDRRKTFTDASQLKDLTWECHQKYGIVFDSLISSPCLEITSFAKQKNPVVQFPWLAGDWRACASLKIIFRNLTPDPARFSLFIWDGIGELSYTNRFQKEFDAKGTWDTICIRLKQPMLTFSGRALELNRIRQVVFFTRHRDSSTIFRLYAVSLE
jgi:hypothetical protein